MVTDVTVVDGVVVGYLTAAEYARRYGIKEATIRQWIRRGKIKAFKIGPVSYISETQEPPEYGKPGRKKKENGNEPEQA